MEKYLTQYYLGKTVNVVVDRPIGSQHPNYPTMIYPVNYGYVPNTVSGDGKDKFSRKILQEQNF